MAVSPSSQPRTMNLDALRSDESLRRAAFPVVEHEIFLANAAICPLPAVARDAMIEYASAGACGNQETDLFTSIAQDARRLAAQLIGAKSDEIALIGPTSLGLSLVALGLDWQPGDQVVYYADDYPANTYCWMNLAHRGVQPVAFNTQQLGAITWADIEPKLTARTRLVSLATCNFISGFRLDYADIGRRLHERGILFCLDAIQTLGAFPMNVEHVDFLAADSHKWMLGPIGAGIFYVKAEHWPRFRPALLGSWNVVSPQFISQPQIEFVPTGQRFEPGALNGPGIVGMAASMQLLLELGIDNIARYLLQLHQYMRERVEALGFQPYLPNHNPANRHGALTFRHPSRDLKALHRHLKQNGVTGSQRYDRAGNALMRFSPHFYNTFAELDRAFALME